MFTQQFAKKLEAYLADVVRGIGDRQAWDKQFGEGAWDKQAAFIYDALRAKAA